MSDYKKKFSNANKKPHLFITPLGAAVVEALPDRKMVAKINHDFKRIKCCPVSALFDEADIQRFYKGEIIPMPIHLYRRKP